MDFVYDIDLILSLRRGIIRTFTNQANLLNSIITSSIDLDHIFLPTFSNRMAHLTFIAGLSIMTIGTIDGLSKNFSSTCFSGSSRSCKQISMRNLILKDRIFQCLSNCLLSYHIRKTLRAPYSVQCLINHFSHLFSKFTSYYYTLFYSLFEVIQKIKNLKKERELFCVYI